MSKKIGFFCVVMLIIFPASIYAVDLPGAVSRGVLQDVRISRSVNTVVVDSQKYDLTHNCKVVVCGKKGQLRSIYNLNKYKGSLVRLSFTDDKIVNNIHVLCE